MDNTKRQTQKIPEAVFIDIDGVLTTGHKYYDQHGLPILKAFYDKDFTACKELVASRVQLFFISGDPRMNMQAILNRGHRFYDARVKKKDDIAREIATDNKLCLPRCMAIGDDIFDIPMLELVGTPVAPADSHHRVLETIEHMGGIKLNSKGGEGCLVELVKILHCSGLNYDMAEVIALDRKEVF